MPIYMQTGGEVETFDAETRIRSTVGKADPREGLDAQAVQAFNEQFQPFSTLPSSDQLAVFGLVRAGRSLEQLREIHREAEAHRW